ncbi:hypothetical protein Fmac_004185 [Flemingia macrophylla]|uniref:Non-haem dioxygenase N-terminal domain-containing protein n=1 Tax=Flemingia macrophylla TaxID=520843 RepID=A0ABD1N476_9FABA
MMDSLQKLQYYACEYLPFEFLYLSTFNHASWICNVTHIHATIANTIKDNATKADTTIVNTTKTKYKCPNRTLIDLNAIKDDEVVMTNAAKLVRKACMKHGFIVVTNHGLRT